MNGGRIGKKRRERGSDKLKKKEHEQENVG